jgi:alkylhydroperoxidase/carboxymuconolactone decarboxylase family protein YurZ
MNKALSRVFASYGATKNYINAIRKVFFDPHKATKLALDTRDRERCIICLLASRGGQVTLAVHIYMALMLEITPEEIANILFLTGVYTGTDNLAMALMTLEKTLKRLNELGGATDGSKPRTTKNKGLEAKKPVPPDGPGVLEQLLADYGGVPSTK